MSIAAADRPFVTGKWQWRWTRRLPFDAQPPLDDPRALSRFFEGRDEEMERAVRTVFYGQNLMVRGSWGIGKTAFILSLIQRLSGEVEEDKGRLLAVYRPVELARADLEHFYRAILYGLCRALAAEDPQARRVLEALTGLRVTRERAGEAKCREALIYALSKKTETISPEVFAAAVEASQNELTVNVPYEQRRLLYLILARQGISFHKGTDIEDLLREAEVQRMWDLLPMLDELVKKDWLYMVEEGGRMVIKVSPLAERAAELGRGQP